MQIFGKPHPITCTKDDELSIVVRYLHSIFFLYYYPDELLAAPNVVDTYLGQLAILKNYFGKLVEDAYDDQEQECDDADEVDAVTEQLTLPFRPLMDQLAPVIPQGQEHAVFSLHDYIYPQWFWYKAQLAQDGHTIEPTRVESLQSPNRPPGEPMNWPHIASLNLASWVPNRYTSRDIELPANRTTHPLLSPHTRVTVSHSRIECFLKGFGPGPGAFFSGTPRELDCYHTIQDAPLPPTMRISRLHGVVIDENRLLGILINYIPHRGTLAWIATRPQERHHLETWIDELDGLVKTLHKAGCVWGDAKPANVLVDESDKLWLIDFGGSSTQGWVDPSCQDTQQGDEQALEKMKDWLRGLAQG